jgi:histidinol-phosphate aminotransferase
MSLQYRTTGVAAPELRALECVRKLKPYLPGKPISELEREYGVSNIIKLASNENPLGASPLALQAMRAELDHLWLYPDGGGFALREKLAALHNVSASQVTLGNGSNDTLALLAESFLGAGREAVFSRYAFAVYPIITQATGATARVASARPASDEQALGHDLEAMLALVNRHTRLVFIANPNNPTGSWLMEPELRGFIEAVPGDTVVVVDEAYYEYGRPLGLPDASQWLHEYPNLVVSRTFSKAYGLAGVRVGYCLSSPAIAGLLGRLRQPFNVNSLALAGAEAALGDQGFIQRSVAANSAGLVQLTSGLQGLGYRPAASAGNFVLVDMGAPAAAINEGLLRRGVIVRPVANYGLPQHLRITIGTEAQNQRLLDALAEVQKAHVAKG